MQSAPTLDPAARDLRGAPHSGPDRPTSVPAVTGGQERAERPVKACFISPLGYGLYRPDSQRPFGGAEVQFFLLAGALSADPAFQVTVLATVATQSGTERHGRLTLVTRQGRNRLARSGSGPVAALKALRGYGAAFLDMLRQLRAINADVYLHAGAGVEVGAYALICRLLRRRFVYVVASSADLGEPSGKVRGPLSWLFPLGIRLAHAVVCRTNDQLADLKRRYGRDGALIRSGHPVPASPHVSRLTPHAILWVGRVHPLKQPELFLALAERLPGERCEMVIMRDAEHDGLLRTVRERAARLANVAVHENVPWSDVGRFFERAKLLVNTSTYEGFPNTFVQAAMHGVPILSWSVDPDGTLAERKAGLCASGSFDRLVEAAGDLCESESRRAELGRRALAYAREHHDLARSVGALKALLRSLAVPRTGVTVNPEEAR